MSTFNSTINSYTAPSNAVASGGPPTAGTYVEFPRPWDPRQTVVRADVTPANDPSPFGTWLAAAADDQPWHSLEGAYNNGNVQTPEERKKQKKDKKVKKQGEPH